MIKVIDPEPTFNSAKERDAWHKNNPKAFKPAAGYKPKVVNGPVGEVLDLHYKNDYSGKTKALRDVHTGYRGYVSKKGFL